MTPTFHNGETFTEGYKRIVKEGREAWFQGYFEIIYDQLKYEYKGIEPKKIIRKAKEFTLLLFPPVRKYRKWKPSVNTPIGRKFLKYPGYVREKLAVVGGYRDKRMETKTYTEERLQAMEYTDLKGKHNLNEHRIWVYNHLDTDWHRLKKAPSAGAMTLLKECQENPKFKYDFLIKIFAPYSKRPLESEAKDDGSVEDAMIDTIDQVLMASKELNDQDELISNMEKDIPPDEENDEFYSDDELEHNDSNNSDDNDGEGGLEESVISKDDMF